LIEARLSAQLLAGPPAAGPVEVAERLLAVQAQDPRGARLAIRARSHAGLGALERALSMDRSLIVSTLNRGTLHLVRADDYPWLQALTAPRTRTANERRLGEEGVGPAAAERGAAVIERELAEHGPRTRAELRAALEAAGVPTGGQGLAHLLIRSCLLGACVRGPMRGREHAYALVRDWLGEPPRVDREAALAELARRYLRGHGPAGERDLARWAGLPLGEVRRGLAAIAAELAELPRGLIDLAGRERPAPLPAPRLLGQFEPLLLGWADRTPILGEHADVVTRNGIFRPIMLVDGRAAGTWRLRAGRVELEPFGRLPAAARARLELDAEGVVAFLARDRDRAVT
jgi:hypothetical protein